MSAADQGWMDRAACLTRDPELFFPIGTTGPAAQQADSAKRICALCPARIECLEYAIETGQDFGVWGGLDEDERRDLRRQESRRARERVA
ncbi:MAG: whiB [Streptosporangiaceae bacterium]|nr:whiB [Streptosporangiaceae bacterium]